MFERAMVVSAEVAQDITDVDAATEIRADDVLVLEFDGPGVEGTRYCFHPRRGMEKSDIAEGLRVLADSIEQDIE